MFFYVFTHIFFSEFSGIDYIIIIYAIMLPLVNDDTAIIYSVIFGLFFDYITDSFIGSGVILFLFFSYLKISSSFFFELTSPLSKILFSFIIILIYVIFNIFYFGYNINTYFFDGILDVISNIFVYLLVFLILELRSAFSIVKR